MNPQDLEDEERDWIADVWLAIVRRALGLPAADLGKESNSLEEVEAGVEHDVENVYTEYIDPSRTHFARHVLPAVKAARLVDLERACAPRIKRRALIDIRAGRSNSAPDEPEVPRQCDEEAGSALTSAPAARPFSMAPSRARRNGRIGVFFPKVSTSASMRSNPPDRVRLPSRTNPARASLNGSRRAMRTCLACVPSEQPVNAEPTRPREEQPYEDDDVQHFR